MAILISKWYNKNGRKLKTRKGVSLLSVIRCQTTETILKRFRYGENA